MKIPAAVDPVDACPVLRNPHPQRGADPAPQPERLFPAKLVAAAQGMQARAVQRLIGVNVADPGDEGLIQKKRLELAFLSAQHPFQKGRSEFRLKRLRPERAQHSLGGFDHPDPPEPARVVESQIPPAVQMPDDMVVLAQRFSRREELQISAHPQMDQQNPSCKPENQEFSPAGYFHEALAAHPLARFLRGGDGERLGMADLDGENFPANERGFPAASGA